MTTEIPLMMQTTYAEILDRTRADAFSHDFPHGGVFVPKTVRGRVYWYFQASSAEGRGQKYVGPETPELRGQIAAHEAVRTWRRDQRSLIAMLIRSGNLPAPPRAIGELPAASGLKVDFLTPNRGKETDEPRTLAAFGMDAQQ